ncbi:fasciclin domain-containing protein [Massilia sp. LC238]|uniref:fasciclin domain-containing protein n=1 Tax=Massilia sp. LC238 TaxID=1502852 RepID=UPI0004E379E1|nr:fasciclin domain-containing protein [Massilia sp. LC238]KFC72028.1 Beta-Ig-H3/fasciclin [Massilia sp. LC238]
MTLQGFLKYGLVVFAFAGTLAGCGSSDDDDDMAPVPVQKNIADVAREQGFTALLAASSKAGIATTLADPNAQLTVFAPTDRAFGDLATRLGFASATAMVDALPASALQNILNYHVLTSRKASSDLAAGGATQQTAYSYAGAPSSLNFDFSSGVKITDAALTSATVTTPNVGASNGVIHVVDKVLVPPGVLNIVQMAQANPVFSSLVTAVVASNLQGTLAGAGPFTVFAPTDTAFAAAPQGLTAAQLRTVLTYHVVSGQVLSTQIPFGTPVATVAGQNIVISAGTPPTIRDTTAAPARITAVDVRASNGVIHVVDKVLIPAL